MFLSSRNFDVFDVVFAFYDFGSPVEGFAVVTENPKN